MNKLVAFVLGGTALIGVSMMGTAQAEPDYAYAATGFVGGGGAWLDGSSICFDETGGGGGICDRDIATIVAGGDIVLPVRGYWNVQLGGAVHTNYIQPAGGTNYTLTQFQGSAIGFWRDPAMGVFGIETGVLSPRAAEGRSTNYNSVKIGGVAEYFFSDMITIGGFGGVLVPFDSRPGKGGKEIDTGFYAGGHLTYYASDNLAFAGFARFTELGIRYTDGSSDEETERSLNVGGKVRYLTSMPGVELYASGSYRECEGENNFGDGGARIGGHDGARFMAGVNMRLGGHSDSLVAIDRSNALDTRAWACDLSTVRIF